VEDEFECHPCRIDEDQKQQRPQPGSLIDCPVDEWDDDQVELDPAQKGKELHEAIEGWT
jgi:hypothetical protein